MILSITKKHLITASRTPFNFFIYLAFPLLLILILGFAFSGMFVKPQISGAVGVINSDNSDLYNQLSENFKYLPNFTFIETEDENRAREGFEKDEYNLLLNIKSKGVNIEYKESSVIRATIAQTFIQSLISKYKLKQVLDSNSLEVQQVDERRDFVKIEAPNSQNGPTALGFYGVTILTMILMYGTYVSSYAFFDERKSGTLSRIAVSPSKPIDIFLGISLGSMVQLIIQTVMVIFLASALLKVNYGSRYLEFYSILLSQGLMVLTMGLFIAFKFKETKVADTIINLIVQFSVFIGGGYFNLPEGGFIDKLSRFSPVYWINKGLFESIYTNNYDYIRPAIIIPVLLALVFTILSVISYKKGEI